MDKLYVVTIDEEFEKARKLGAKDIKKRKKRMFKIGKTPEGETRYGPAPTKKWFGSKPKHEASPLEEYHKKRAASKRSSRTY